MEALLEGMDIEQIAGDEAAFAGLGAVRKNNPARGRQLTRQAVLKTKRASFAQGKSQGSAPTLTGAMTSRAWFELKKGELPKETQAQLASGALQSVDCVLYATKAIGGKSMINLIEPSDDKKTGVCNINGAKLDVNDFFLLTAIGLDYGIYTDTPADCDFNDDYPAVIKNGEFEFKVGSVSLVPDALSMEAFNQEGVSTKRSHVFVFDNPKWIVPQTELKPKLYLPVGAEDKTAVKIILFGTKVAKR